MISPWPAGSAPQKIEQGFVVFHVNGLTQHAGIAATSADFDAPVQVYAAARGLREAWNSASGTRPSRWKVRVMGWVSHPQYESEAVLDRVLMCCHTLEKLLEGRPDRRRETCCWQIREPYRLVQDHETATIIFTGSCAGFVEHCYEQAGVDLVKEASLPPTEALRDEADYILEEYAKAPDQRIRRLYPAYQIRALQQDSYPWEPDLAFRWYPENFER